MRLKSKPRVTRLEVLRECHRHLEMAQKCLTVAELCLVRFKKHKSLEMLIGFIQAGVRCNVFAIATVKQLIDKEIKKLQKGHIDTGVP